MSKSHTDPAAAELVAGAVTAGAMADGRVGRNRPTPARSVLRHGLEVAAFNTAVATLLWLIRGSAWDIAFVYAQATGLCIWALIESGARWLRGDSERFWPGGWRSPMLLAASTAIGYVVGTVIGDLYCGCSTWQVWALNPRAFISYAVMSLTVSVIVVYYFHSRGEAERQRALVSQAEADATKARLDMLRSQIEPHMLFNTLANLRVLITLDPARAQTMLDQLIAFLRATLDASRAGSHPLSAEFARIEDYLALMKVRMGPRLHTTLDLPDALRGLAVPPLLLQPLVENAIKHGLEPKIEGGRIDVTARRESGQLWLTVRDTGLGLDAAPNAGTQFGLHQVRERLSTLFGTAASLDLTPADDAEGGAIVTLKLPIQT